MKITVLGSGGWGTALALLLLENGNDVTLWSYHQAESDTLRTTHENPLLKGVVIPEEMKFTCDLSAVKGCGLVVMATPSFAVRSTAAQVKDLLDPTTPNLRIRESYERGVYVESREEVIHNYDEILAVASWSERNA